MLPQSRFKLSLVIGLTALMWGHSCGSLRISSACLLLFQFTLEDARERLANLHGSPAGERRTMTGSGSRLDPASVREQRHSIHVLTSPSPSTPSHGEYWSHRIIESLCHWAVGTEPLFVLEQLPTKVMCCTFGNWDLSEEWWSKWSEVCSSRPSPNIDGSPLRIASLLLSSTREWATSPRRIIVISVLTSVLTPFLHPSTRMPINNFWLLRILWRSL